MDTFFGSPEKTSENQLTKEIECVSKSPITSSVLNAVGGLLAILDKNRQVVALNKTFMEALGITDITDITDILGLRPGEFLECIHANEEPNGCGTTKFCVTCGAAISIVTSLTTNEPCERQCAMTANKDGKDVELVFSVRSYPVKIDGNGFIMLFIQDITKQEYRASLERIFFHDINNLLSVVSSMSEMAKKEFPSAVTENLFVACNRLLREIQMQKYLINQDNYLPLEKNDVVVNNILIELENIFKTHKASKGKYLTVNTLREPISIKTDISIIMRILSNMLINAFEASGEMEKITLFAEADKDIVTFNVHNSAYIPETVQIRIFQKNFSTKDQDGRGFGTFSMKLLGEKLLGGLLSFKSSPEEGTTFSLRLLK